VRYAYDRTRKDGAVGVDHQTAEEYAADLEQNLHHLVAQLQSGRYRAPPVRRHYIPKADGSKRGLGIPSFADKVAQRAIVLLLEPIYEQDFPTARSVSDQSAVRTKRCEWSVARFWNGVEDGFWTLICANILTASIQPSSENFTAGELPMG
jgi:hypothetical protein